MLLVVIVITFVIGGFSWVYDPITPFDYNPTQWLVKNKKVNAPVKFDEIVMVMINQFTEALFTLYKDC